MTPEDDSPRVRHSGQFAVIAAKIIFDARLSHAAFRILGALAANADEDGVCYPRQGGIAHRLGISQSAVAQSVKQLVALGYLEVRRFRAPGEEHARNHYRILADQGTPLADMQRAAEQANISSPNISSPNISSANGNRTVPVSRTVPAKRTSPISEDNFLLTSLAHSAETAPSADLDSEGAAPPDRRTRERVFQPAMERDPLFTALVDALTYRPLTRREWGQWATVINDLRSISATPEQVANVVRAFRATHPQAEVTPFAIVNNWAAMTQKASTTHAATTVPTAEEMDAARASERDHHARRLADWAAFEAELVADGLSQPPAPRQSRAVR